jgi:hypothetical protein
MRFALFTLVIGFGSGCANALHPYTSGVPQRIRVDATNPQQFAFRVRKGEEQKIRDDGTINFKVPRFHNCSRYVLGMRIYDGTPEKMKVIELTKNERTIQKLSLERIAELPKDKNGYAILKPRD